LSPNFTQNWAVFTEAATEIAFLCWLMVQKHKQKTIILMPEIMQTDCTGPPLGNG